MEVVGEFGLVSVTPKKVYDSFHYITHIYVICIVLPKTIRNDTNHIIKSCIVVVLGSILFPGLT